MDKYNDVFLYEGVYGVGKTTLAVLNAINKLTNNPNAWVFTDIKFKNLPPTISDRLFHYEPTEHREIEYTKYGKKHKEKRVFFSLMEMLEIVRLIKLDYDVSGRPRSERLEFYFYLDETGDIFNKYNDNQGGLETLYGYIVQMRKLNIWIYLISQQYMYLSLKLRILVSKCYVLKRIPILGKLPFFCNFTLVYREKKDPETGRQTTVLVKKRNKEGDRYNVEKPVGGFTTIFWKPTRWKYYDDLHMTMRETYPFPLSEYSISNYQYILSKFKKGYLKKSWKQSFRSIFTRELLIVSLGILYILRYFFF